MNKQPRRPRRTVSKTKAKQKAASRATSKATSKAAHKGMPSARRASDAIDEARVALTKGWPMTDANTHATLVLFALARALRREDPAALAVLASAAREALVSMGEADGQPPPRADWTNAGHSAVSVDEAAHRRLVAKTMSEMLIHHREALASADPRKPPPLPAAHMAQTLSRLLGSGPLRNSYRSQWTPEKDGDVDRILEAWTKYLASDGCIRVDEEPVPLARKLVADALAALGASANRLTSLPSDPR